MTNRIIRLAGTTTLAAALSISTALTAGAQQADARWQAWVGCWQPSSGGAAIVGAATLCVSPVRSGAAIEIATIDSATVKARDTVDASGVLRTIAKDGCTGTERGEWSKDNRRVYRHVELTCTGGLKRVANTITSITPMGEWLDVQSVNVNGAAAVRATHYFPIAAGNTAGLPAEFKNVGANVGLAVASARTVAAGALDVSSLVEAVRSTDTLAVQSWIIERGAAFTNLDDKMLVRLADAGVPGAVTDVMIGASYPDHFALKAASPTMGYNAYSELDSARIANRARCDYGIASVWSSIYDPTCGSLSSRRYGSRYGYYDYLYGYGYPYSVLGYGYPYYGSSLYYGGVYGGYHGAPVVIVKGSDQPAHGRVVNGSGYSCGSCSTRSSGSASPTSTGGGVDRSSGYSGGSSASTAPSSSSSSGTSSGSSSSGDGGRTAHPRPPQI
jgi:hypothetical protein